MNVLIDNPEKNQTINVLITGPEQKREGGVANYFSVLLPELNCGYQYFVLGSRQNNEKRYLKPFILFRDYWKLSKLLRREDIDLVHVNPSMIPLPLIRDGITVLLARLMRKKTLVFFHGWVQSFADKISRFPWRLFRNLLLKADASVVLAQDFAQQLNDWGYTKTIFTESMIVEPSVFPVAQRRAETSDLRPPTILFLSRLVKTKGLFEAIEAIHLVKKEFPELRAIIAGSGAAEAEARDMCSNDSWIRFAGFLTGEAKEEVYTESDIYLLPTYREGMPNTVLEAMAAGLAVVTRPVGGIPDFFENDKMGALIPSLEAEDFARACIELLKSEKKRKAIAAYNTEYAGRHFYAGNVARRLELIYHRVAVSTDKPPSDGPIVWKKTDSTPHGYSK